MALAVSSLRRGLERHPGEHHTILAPDPNRQVLPFAHARLGEKLQQDHSGSPSGGVQIVQQLAFTVGAAFVALIHVEVEPGHPDETGQS